MYLDHTLPSLRKDAWQMHLPIWSWILKGVSRKSMAKAHPVREEQHPKDFKDLY